MNTRHAIVVGGGTAGLIAAISLVRLAGIRVTVIRSSDIGHIMVGEGTFSSTPRLLHDVLGIPRPEFFDKVNPTWKLGIHFLWGNRPYFDFPFSFAVSHDNQILPGTEKPWGYYNLDEHLGRYTTVSNTDPAVLAKMQSGIGYHFENQRFVEYLEGFFTASGGQLLEGKVTDVVTGDHGIAYLRTADGRQLDADLFIDASGFSGRLIHGAMAEPYVPMSDRLFCDTAVVGGWRRGEDEPIKPYTTAETFSSGWCWQIEHETIVNRGYVYSSKYQTPEAAAAEYLSKNPKVDPGRLRTVPFESRRIRRAWVKNVVAIGNSCGFVEPLEATNIQLICEQSIELARLLTQEDVSKASDEYNGRVVEQWNDICDFLSLHYKFNDRLDTPFWRMAQEKTSLGKLDAYVQRYLTHGPMLYDDAAGQKYMFGADGNLAILLGMGVPWAESPAVRRR
ncbi:tryptophan halogenase [Roseateles sp. YR242]|uniref:FAD-dependent oxidoreductase n=1 Tax=Roseateles sp. YR242 TaxID=1855305 RepID=UPI0008C59316|nr:FAD-dependent oxidoreductase [Roseateles sp. YR242]SEL52092.1 tryptophan halogenase [Roseateles sp. YR242]